MSPAANRVGWTFGRGAGVAGLGSAVLMFASAALSNTPDGGSATDQRLIDFYTDSGNQSRIYLAALLGLLAWAGLVVAVLMLPSIVFFAGLTLVGLMVWTAGRGHLARQGPATELTTDARGRTST